MYKVVYILEEGTFVKIAGIATFYVCFGNIFLNNFYPNVKGEYGTKRYDGG